jgi:hypothetical protein
MSLRARWVWWLATFTLSLAAGWLVWAIAGGDNFLAYWVAVFGFGTLWSENLAAWQHLRNRDGRDG